MTTTTNRIGYVACNSSEGDMLADVGHADVRATYEQAEADRRAGYYETVRWVGADGYLYVERPE